MNKKIKTAIILISIILIAVLAISLSYSRYFSTVKGTGTATVAKWSFKVNGATDTIAEGINLTDTMTTNDNVAEGKIAPGTSGELTVELDATGTEVALDYTIAFSNVKVGDAAGSFPTNLKFYATKTGDTYSDPIADITAEGLTGTIGLTDEQIKSVTIYWEWKYQTGTDDNTILANDKTDTDEGKAAATTTFDVVVTGTQKGNV